MQNYDIQRNKVILTKNLEFFIHTLPNGIRCILRRIDSPVAYCAVTVDAGSRDELPSEHGLAHFTEHSLFKGTRRRKAWHINNRLEKLGGELNAFTSKEETVVHATCLCGDLPKAAELISDVLFNSVFPAREIEKEREVVLEEIGYYKDSPGERIYDEFEDMLFAGSSIGHNILGDEASVEGFTCERIAGFVGRCYNTDRMIFSVAASMTEKSFVKLCEYAFGEKPLRPRAFVREAPPVVEPFVRSADRGTHQAHCIVGGRAYDAHDRRRTALSLLINILGGPAANSLLNTTLREKYGYTYNIEASYTPYCDTGAAAIYFSCEKDKAARCVELVHRVLDRLKKRELSGRQLAQAQKQYIGQISIAMENRESYMLGAAKSLLVYDKVDSAEEIYRKLSAITAKEVIEAANDIFTDTSSLLFNGGSKYAE